MQNLDEIAKRLANIDAPDHWNESCPPIKKNEKNYVFELSEQLWLKRMVESKKLYLHPSIFEQLHEQLWVANDLQKRMIWASVLASCEGNDSKVRFRKIKESLLKKHGRDWWEDVYPRIKKAWAAKERIRKKVLTQGSAVSVLINNTHLFQSFAIDEWNRALEMIPKK